MNKWWYLIIGLALGVVGMALGAKYLPPPVGCKKVQPPGAQPEQAK